MIFEVAFASRYKTGIATEFSSHGALKDEFEDLI